MAVSKRLRYEILRRDSFTCRYCGASAPDVPLRVDHVTPVALGGGDEPTNLATSCEPCNSGKTSSTPDAALVADISSDALRWAAALKQAAEELRAKDEPKHAYRAAFEAAWGGWTWGRSGKKKPLDLPGGWKTSLDAFREAGLPEEVWPDVVEKAMTNPTVKFDNTFRYCCGIAWRMVRELQEQARLLVGLADSAGTLADSVVQAAIDVWDSEQQGTVDAGEREVFRASAIAARGSHDAHRIVEAAQWGVWYGEPNVASALAKVDAGEAVQAWTNSWITTAGKWPDDEQSDRVNTQCEALIAADVNVSRVVRAATYAGSRRSVRLYFGLTEDELEITGQHEFLARSAELWAGAFKVSAGRWPQQDELSVFFKHLSRIGSNGAGFWLDDVYCAASAAGAYQDPDLSTCLTRHLSVFEVAAFPLAAAA
jgi:HNH endonuclease